MTRTLRAFFFALLLLLLACLAQAQTPNGRITAYGIYEVEVVDLAHDSGGAGSDVRMTEQTLVETTWDVPMIDGTSFGFTYIFEGQGDLQVTANITAPNGRVLSGPFPIRLGLEESFSYTLGPTLQSIGPGTYDLFLSQDGRRLLGMTFNLFRP